MKKIYSLTLIGLLGIFFFINASSPITNQVYTDKQAMNLLFDIERLTKKSELYCNKNRIINCNIDHFVNHLFVRLRDKNEMLKELVDFFINYVRVSKMAGKALRLMSKGDDIYFKAIFLENIFDYHVAISAFIQIKDLSYRINYIESVIANSSNEKWETEFCIVEDAVLFIEEQKIRDKYMQEIAAIKHNFNCQSGL